MPRNLEPRTSAKTEEPKPLTDLTDEELGQVSGGDDNDSGPDPNQGQPQGPPDWGQPQGPDQDQGPWPW